MTRVYVGLGHGIEDETGLVDEGLSTASVTEHEAAHIFGEFLQIALLRCLISSEIFHSGDGMNLDEFRGAARANSSGCQVAMEIHFVKGVSGPRVLYNPAAQTVATNVVAQIATDAAMPNRGAVNGMALSGFIKNLALPGALLEVCALDNNAAKLANPKLLADAAVKIIAPALGRPYVA